MGTNSRILWFRYRNLKPEVVKYSVFDYYKYKLKEKKKKFDVEDEIYLIYLLK